MDSIWCCRGRITFYNDLNTLSFEQDDSGNWGYKVGADSVIPFKSQIDIDNAYQEGYNTGVSSGNKVLIETNYSIAKGQSYTINTDFTPTGIFMYSTGKNGLAYEMAAFSLKNGPSRTLSYSDANWVVTYNENSVKFHYPYGWFNELSGTVSNVYVVIIG